MIPWQAALRWRSEVDLPRLARATLVPEPSGSLGDRAFDARKRDDPRTQFGALVDRDQFSNRLTASP